MNKILKEMAKRNMAKVAAMTMLVFGVMQQGSAFNDPVSSGQASTSSGLSPALKAVKDTAVNEYGSMMKLPREVIKVTMDTGAAIKRGVQNAYSNAYYWMFPKQPTFSDKIQPYAKAVAEGMVNMLENPVFQQFCFNIFSKALSPVEKGDSKLSTVKNSQDDVQNSVESSDNVNN